MWADTLLSAEQQHLIRLLAWAALSIVAGTTVATVLAARRVDSALLKHFSAQMAIWGAAVGIVSAVGWRTAHLRDLAGAARLERIAWMNIGMDTGYAMAGATLAIAGWRLGRRLGVVGAGTAIVIQGLALLVLELQFAAVISR